MLHNNYNTPTIPLLQLFYEEDLLEESVLLEWAEKVSKKYVSRDLSEEMHKLAQPFIKWLREAEEEESESETDEDDELEVSCHLDCFSKFNHLYCNRNISLFQFISI